MKKKSSFIKMVGLLVAAGADLTPKERVVYCKRDNFEGVRPDEVSMEDVWSSVLFIQVDNPVMYEHMCYGVYNPSDTQKSEY